MNIDIELHFEGIWMLETKNDNVREWLRENIDGEQSWLGNSLACKERYMDNLCIGLIGAGFNIMHKQSKMLMAIDPEEDDQFLEWVDMPEDE